MNLEKCVNVRISTKASKNEGSFWSPQIISSAISLKVSTSASRFAVVTVVVRATTSLSRRSSSRENLSLRFTALSRFANIPLPPHQTTNRLHQRFCASGCLECVLPSRNV